MQDNIAAPVSALRAALSWRHVAPRAHAEHLGGWRLSLLNGLCAASCYLGLLVAFPSIWFSAICQLWGLVAADIVALAIVMLLHFRRDIDYRYRAAAFLATGYLPTFVDQLIAKDLLRLEFLYGARADER